MKRTTKKAPKQPAQKVAKPAKAARGKFTGMKLRLAQPENVRKEGTPGHRSAEIIRKKPGISFEDYRAAGGVARDLQWDIAHGWTKASA